MSDVFSKEKRSWIMSRISGRDTKPEIIVRKLIHSLGFRFRLHVRTLPGNPDIVLPKHRKIIFVHGCFWHGHENCKRSRRPSTNTGFWDKKISGNIERDKTIIVDLYELGWNTLSIWQCDIKNQEKLFELLRNYLFTGGNKK
jgi:DNA mismatch endonuclease (patch repair protein)